MRWAAPCALGLLATACAGGADSPDRGGIVAGETTLTVFAAASLTDAFTELGERFETANPGVSVQLSFGPSSGLATQLLEGAPADVYAAAATEPMDEVAAAGVVGAPAVFATNTLQLAVPAGNPGGVQGIEDLADASLAVGLCADDVPCGRFSRELLDLAGVTAAPDTNEADVRALLTKLGADELDVGIVYRTDVVAGGGGVEGIDVPGAEDVVARYPIGVVAGTDSVATAEAFVALVTGDEGREVLAAHGFGAP